ncbi:hypothetical protein JCM10207_006643 [Rhodosporidiobolus poonsookiae]
MASRSSSTISDARRNAAPYPPPGTTRGANVAQSAARSGASASQANARPTFSYKTWEGGKMDEVDVTLTTDAEEVQKVLSKMSGSPLGFDLEWEFEMGPDNKAQTHYPTALAQVCDETHVLLVHLAKMDSFPDALKELVEDRNRIKIGVGIAGDARKLKNDFELNARAMLDLNVLGRKYIPKYFGPGFNGKDFLRSLKTLTGTYLKCDLPKEMSIRAGQWAGELNEQQIECKFLLYSLIPLPGIF